MRQNNVSGKKETFLWCILGDLCLDSGGTASLK